MPATFRYSSFRNKAAQIIALFNSLAVEIERHERRFQIHFSSPSPAVSSVLVRTFEAVSPWFSYPTMSVADRSG